MRTRVKGKPVLVRSLMSLELRVIRFGQLRANRPEDLRWAAETATRLREIRESRQPEAL